ncbi:PASTA domain-containing protein [Streptomyces sp. SID13726]|uniref:PASTA domain-containing protein n=1 Tax=Streptomyces sp. SID13726 TaxID=2706058 RepID=UPI0013B68745|nr:PASTA domain-containing protein [Streptomyces sp. SID13726]NEB02619.1 PASTA domain-containing protein [Streptomyces sp. SID13726]
MANWRLVGAIAAAVLVIGGTATACGPDNSTGSGADSTPSTSTSTSTTTGTPTASTAAGAPAEKKTVPSFVGKGLQSAQDEAQAAGFYNLASHDALGRDRFQAFDRNWKVCSQNLAAGKTVPVDTRLDFGAVKLEEDCPAKDQNGPTAAGAAMPDFKGKSVKAARAALDSSTSITVKDATGDDRLVLVESNWQVCTQSPKADTELSGQPVEFTAVKYGEHCP